MKWWHWVIIILVLLCWVVSLIGSSARAIIRKEYLAFIREKHPEVKVIAEKKNSVVLKFGAEDEIEGFFDNIYTACSGVNTLEARQAVYEHFLTGLKDGPKKGEKITLATHGSKIMPRIVPSSILDEVHKLGGIPNRPFADTGLIIAYVFDYPDSVVYITNKHLVELEIDENSLYELAMTNLKKTFSADIIKGVLEKQNVSMLKTMDSYDAARVLLLPANLPENAQVAALIPDRDTLAIAPVPADGNWSKLKKLARAASGKPLFGKPLLVSRKGFKTIQ